MVLLDIPLVGENFLVTWAILTVLALVALIGASGLVFYHYYWAPNVTFEKWQRKSNPKFPSPSKVRDEVIQMLKGLFTATLCPAASLYLAKRGMSKAYAGVSDEHPASHQVLEFLGVWMATDLWSFSYHRLGHEYKAFWNNHRHHHVFFNPSPFAVIADEYIDQFFRSAPMVVFPLVVPINMDLMFLQNALFFYFYGVYLHWGYESDMLSAHNPIMNTSFQHYCHHAKAILGKPYHCGFFFKIWDQLCPGGIYPADKCFCAICEKAKGKRSLELYKKVEIPDYSVLLSLSFWLDGTNSAAAGKETLTKEELVFEQSVTGTKALKSH